jgi:hypothetical protein
MNKLLTILLLVFVAMLNSCAPANRAPTSADGLKEKFEAALKAGDTNAILSLYNWDGVSSSMKSFQVSYLKGLSGFLSKYPTNEIRTSVWLQSLTDDDEMEGVRDGIRYRPNVSVVGMMQGSLDVNDHGTNTGWGPVIPYGEKNGRFYFSGTTTEKIYEPKTKDKFLTVSVTTGTISNGSPTFTGTFTYVQNGAEIKKDISGKGVARKRAFGDYVKSSHVQKTSDNGAIQLSIIENGTNVFESQPATNNVPIVYEKKS